MWDKFLHSFNVDIKLLVAIIGAALIKIHFEMQTQGWHPWRGVASFFTGCFLGWLGTDPVSNYLDIAENSSRYFVAGMITLFGHSLAKLLFTALQNFEGLKKLLSLWRGK